MPNCALTWSAEVVARMPAKPAWLLQLPDIISLLEQMDVPVVDRATCERLFGIRRRRAITLLEMFGGYQAGRTYLVSRTDLIDQLRAFITDPAFKREQARKRRLTSSLDELHRRRAATQIRIPVAPIRAGHQRSLPDGIVAASGILSITYWTTEHLLGRLYALAIWAADDYDAFCAVVEANATDGE